MIPQPQYQFNLGQPDPLLTNRQVNIPDYYAAIDQEIQRLNIMKQQIPQDTITNQSPMQSQNNIWIDIDAEVSSLTDAQKDILAKDEDYFKIDQEVQYLIQKELIDSIKNKVYNSVRGKELLEQQLRYVKVKKTEFAKESDKEIELFKKFQNAVQRSPDLTYPEFIKALNAEKL